MRWIEVTVETVPERLDGVCTMLEDAGVEGFIIEDEQEYTRFLEENRQYWDYVDEAFAASMRGLCRVRFYTSEDADGDALRSSVRALLKEERISEKPVQDEDWENNWKAYYKPIPVGSRLLIVPQWEEAPPSGGRVVLRLDPGLIFGTGSHATTQMCLAAAESVPLADGSVLDLGCGSGILAIAALLLGAKEAFGCDIDPKAPDVVSENAALNGVENRLHVFCGNCADDPSVRDRLGGRRYSAVFANIVADVILRLIPWIPQLLEPGGTFITSGIIDGREAEVSDALLACGFSVERHLVRDCWHCLVCRHPS